MTGHIIIFLIVAIVLLLIGVPVAATLGLSSILFFVLEGIPAMTVVQRLFSGCDVAALMCIPFFILAGDLMAKGGIAKRLVNVCNMAIGLGIVAWFVCRKNGWKGMGRGENGSQEKFHLGAFLKALLKAIPAIGSPVIILGSIYSGICTPTESAVLAVLYSLIIGIFVYKEISIKDIPQILFNSAKGTANIMFIVAGAALFAFVVSYAQLPQMLVHGLLGISDNKYVILFIILVILLIMGCIMDATPILLITIPMFLPVIQQLGISTLQFGIVMCTAVCIGFVTPPFGTCLFTGMSVSGVSMQKLVKAILPFIISMLVVLLLITFIPQLTLWIAK